ncbi:unnamed protein product [Kuraishia capsulata CBS 1993]|uniref:F-box domain-containing protein n=1 Tax=Kuraishia capsulata CBS 1993 TaxID=1382522 RepID=W6MT58_9ASCO|nr:uncharacterized protein KUCA_T00005996001 [Kuraishia capsulata CBS 1993]CDK30001.1 unnamed protein product [Kuraishia capsulata CBS 1993]
MDSLGNYTERSVEPELGSFGEFPPEILAVIFSHLDPHTLNSLRAVSRLWDSIAGDDQVWRLLYRREFGYAGSLTRGNSWRQEYLTRSQAQDRWLRGKAVHHSSTLSQIHVSRIAVDFANERLFCSSMAHGGFTVSDLKSNKEPLFIRCAQSGFTSFDFGKNGMAMGKWDGSVTIRLFQSDKNDLLSDGSADMITATCVAKGHLPGHQGTVGCLTGDSQGWLKAWDMRFCQRLNVLRVGTEPIVAIVSDFDGNVLVKDATSRVFAIHNFGTPRQLFYGEPSAFVEFAAVDYGGRRVVINAGAYVAICSFDQSTFGQTTTYIPSSTVFKVAIDENSASRRPTSHPIAGADSCMCAILEKSGMVVIIDLRDLSTVVRTQFGPRASDVAKVEAGESPPVCSICVNSVVCLLGFYNGYVAVHSSVTGEFMRSASVRIPKRLVNYRNTNIAVANVAIDPDASSARGVFSCGSCIQYFEFGHAPRKQREKRGFVRGGTTDKRDGLLSKMRQEYDDYQHLNHEQELQDARFETFNGDVGSDIELEMAIALSQSIQQPSRTSDEDDHLRLALAMSARSQEPHGYSENEDEDEQLRLAMEISRLETGADAGVYTD